MRSEEQAGKAGRGRLTRQGGCRRLGRPGERTARQGGRLTRQGRGHVATPPPLPFVRWCAARDGAPAGACPHPSGSQAAAAECRARRSRPAGRPHHARIAQPAPSPRQTAAASRTASLPPPPPHPHCEPVRRGCGGRMPTRKATGPASACAGAGALGPDAGAAVPPLLGERRRGAVQGARFRLRSSADSGRGARSQEATRMPAPRSRQPSPPPGIVRAGRTNTAGRRRRRRRGRPRSALP